MAQISAELALAKLHASRTTDLMEKGLTSKDAFDEARYGDAPYRHFKAKEDLLRAVRALAFLGLFQTMKEAEQQSTAGSRAQILTLGDRHVVFAEQQHAFFGLM